MESDQEKNSAADEVVFIDDLPVDGDEFEGGAHARVAAAIIDTIKANDGGRAIGLEGTWGSGKSSVIEMVAARLSTEKGPNQRKHAILIFDSWAHQGDPIRRSFLERMITQLESRKVITGDNWETEMENLRAPVTRTRTTSSPTLTVAGKALIFFAPILPLAYFWATPVGLKKLFSITLFSYPLGLWVLLVIFSPYLVFAVEFIHRHTFGRSRPKSSNSIFALFNPSSNEVITEQVSKSSEPTTLEFNSVFDKIVENAKSNSYRLVIVIDNLDRLPNQLIQEVWATMRNFFAAPSTGGRAEILKNVWLIVPFDRAHMEEVFEEDTGSANDSGGFIDKTFEIIFRVSPPLLSHWNNYFDQKLNVAFKNKLSAEERHIVFKLLELSFVSKKEPVTPRAIKSFVNALVAQVKQWGDEIPLRHQALYILQRKELAKNIHKLEDSTVLDPRTAGIVRGTEWAKYVAAAHYNVPPENALEILLDLPTEEALASHNIKRLEELQANSGFEHSCVRLIEEKAGDWAQSEPATFIEINASLDEIDFENKAVYMTAWRQLTFASDHLGSWTQFSDHTAEGMAALIKNAPNGHAEDCAKVVLKSLSSLQGEISTSSEHGTRWFEVIDALASALEHAVDEDAKEKVFTKYQLPGTADFVFGVAAGCHESEVLSFDTFKLPVGGDEIANSVTTEVQRLSLTDEFAPAISSLLSVPESCEWTNVIPSIQKRLGTNEPVLTPDDALTLLRVLHDISSEASVDQAKSALSDLAANSSLFGVLKFAREKNHIDLQAETISALIGHYEAGAPPKADPHPQYGNIHAEIDSYQKFKNSPDEAPELVKAITIQVQRYVDFDTLLTFAIEDGADRELFRELVKQIIDEHEPRRLSLQQILTDYDRAIQTIGEQREEKFLRALDGWESFVSEELEGDNIYVVSERFFQRGAKLNTKLWQTVRGLAMTHLRGLSQQKWLEELKDEGDALALLLGLIRHDINQKLSVVFRGALVDHSREVIDGTAEPEDYPDQWHLLPLALQENVRKTFYKDIRDLLLNGLRSGEEIRRLSRLFEPEFLEKAALEDKASEVVRLIVCRILEEGDEESLQYLDEHIEIFSNCVKKADRVEKGLLKETISNAMEREGIDKDRYAKLASNFGVKIKKPKNPPSE